MSDTLYHAKNYQHASDILDAALAADSPWDAHSVRLLAKKMSAWLEELERDNSLLHAGLKFAPSRGHRRPPARPPKESCGRVPYIEGASVALPEGPVCYFLEGIGSGLVKIGWSVFVSARLADLAINSPTPLRLLCWERILGRQCEQALHAQFDEYRVHGEWFRMEGRLLEYINNTKSVRRRSAQDAV